MVQPFANIQLVNPLVFREQQELKVDPSNGFSSQPSQYCLSQSLEGFFNYKIKMNKIYEQGIAIICFSGKIVVAVSGKGK
jgi:hypothetical protein